ncbi:hypothetical protein D9757_010612 [Collybiopsis confluens]|uniref:Uncharacterized protein n=1 Tax=Collybiopsis confluens TaxID=2823264 RepID=A0A8H5LUL9_9AGAR|nr:hypothetical protein D9757_010612 [Collybiopsis confluens]
MDEGIARILGISTRPRSVALLHPNQFIRRVLTIFAMRGDPRPLYTMGHTPLNVSYLLSAQTDDWLGGSQDASSKPLFKQGHLGNAHALQNQPKEEDADGSKRSAFDSSAADTGKGWSTVPDIDMVVIEARVERVL